MNILLTDHCNLQCPYCFATNKLVADKKNLSHMSLKNLKIALDFCKKSGERRIGVLGGEPTLHPYFGKMIKMIVNSGLDFTLFTNGIVSNKKDIELLRALDPKNAKITLNVNERDFYSDKENKLLVQFLKDFE